MTRILLAAALLALALLASPRADSAPLVRIDLLDRETGALLPAWPHRGDTWVPGTPGHRYGVRLANQSGGRVLVVLSVDGINAVSGETAAPGQAGYVLEPWATAEITGWRKSLHGVAQFQFTDLGDSQAGGPEAQAPAAAQESARDGYTGSAQSLGTGHGLHEWSPVSQTGFVRASRHPAQVTELRYDDGHRLALRGIAPRPRALVGPWPQRPQAFPRGFVPDP